MAKIIVNGKNQEISENSSLLELIKINNVLQPEMVSIQLNEEFVNRENYGSTLLKDGDAIDFLYFMGGGQ